ncbi:hypothetical protein NXY15_10705 [Bacteroides thetaiotaomicron]|nr:hypothetical protein NXY15_10705 [Bacteroides thetaiotaomicron]
MEKQKFQTGETKKLYIEQQTDHKEPLTQGSVTAKFAVTLPSPTAVTSLITHIQDITPNKVTDDSNL